jgi:hypothetical protein
MTEKPQSLTVIPDSEFCRWKLVKKAAFAEKAWMHDRLKWLFSPQTILFAAYGLTMQPAAAPRNLLAALRFSIALLGATSSFIVLFVVLAAARMHLKWTREMQSIAREYPKDVTFGSRPYWPAGLARWLPLLLPLCFGLVWLYILKVQQGF